MPISPIVSAIKQICEEKGISEAEVLEAIEAALAAAYRKDFGQPLQNVRVSFDPGSGEMKVFDLKTVVEDELKEKWEDELKEKTERRERGEEAPAGVPETEEKEELKYSPKLHTSLTDAEALKEEYKVGDEIKTALEVPASFGRVAAQTAKQVIIQKLKEAERNALMAEFQGKQGHLITGSIGRRERDAVLVDLGRIMALFPTEEQIPEERYITGARMKFLVSEVRSTIKGPQVILSRSRPAFVKEIFSLEIPEIAGGIIEIKGIARAPGSRTKIAVLSKKENVDPVGACIGQRGVRVQTVMAEIGGEKIDVIEFSDDPATLLTRALSPSKPTQITLSEKDKIAYVRLNTDQLSLAIGRGGQNVRLASELTGWVIELQEIKQAGEVPPEAESKESPAESEAK
jgi:N utilization substance protein A